MKFKIYSVYDAAVGAYMQPFFMRSKGEALRGWMDAVNDPKTQFHAHPKDFTLFEIAEYDEDDGSIIPYSAKVALGNALELKTRPQQEGADLALAKKLTNVTATVNERAL